MTEYTRVGDALNCPNCGAPINSDKCEYCGTSFVDLACIDTDRPFFIKFKKGFEIHITKVRLTSFAVHQDISEGVLYADDRPFMVASPVRPEIDLTLQMVE